MRKNTRGLVAVIIVLSVILAGLLAFAASLPETPREPTLQTGSPTDTAQTGPAGTTGPATTPGTSVPATQPTQPPTEPPVRLEATATLGVTGDILLHDRVIRSGYDSQTGTYNYDDIFPFFREYVSRVDYAVANLEVTLCGDDNGYKYQGYPCFNSPDAIVDALKNAGFDMLLTANNHSYDTRNKGLLRTQNTLLSKGMQYIGTRLTQEDPDCRVVDVNGIPIGMVNYTYNTSQDGDGTVSLNGIPLTNADSKLVNSFNYSQLESFYARLSSQMQTMYAQGAKAIVLYIHWGDEYRTTQNAKQSEMAQALCDLGVDVIIGNHAHVPQPVELLTSSQDESHKTLCLYSTGNSVSNISRADRLPINTEDGMLFSVTFAQYSDGTVLVQSAQVLPTWVWRHDVNGVREFTVLTLDSALEDWKAHLSISDEVLSECRASYDRTMAIVGPGLEAANSWFAQNQANLEAELGVAQ